MKLFHDLIPAPPPSQKLRLKTYRAAGHVSQGAPRFVFLRRCLMPVHHKILFLAFLRSVFHFCTLFRKIPPSLPSKFYDSGYTPVHVYSVMYNTSAGGSVLEVR